MSLDDLIKRDRKMKRGGAGRGGRGGRGGHRGGLSRGGANFNRRQGGAQGGFRRGGAIRGGDRRLDRGSRNIQVSINQIFITQVYSTNIGKVYYTVYLPIYLYSHLKA